MEPLKGVVFDMDDTLYPERDYVRSGFTAVAARFDDSERAFDHLWREFEGGTRGNAFDRLLREMGPEGAGHSIETLVAHYRTHPPTIAPFPQIAGILDSLQTAGVRIGLISDGLHGTQAAKFAALGGDARFDPAILTGALGAEFSKPHPRAFETVAEAWGLTGASLAYVGDNPKKDFVAPNRLGWRSVRLRLPGGIYADLEPSDPSYRATVEVTSLEALNACLQDWCGA